MPIDANLNLVLGRSERRRLVDKFTFRIKSGLISDMGFVTASELKVSTEVIRYRAGGSLLPVKNPGLSDFDPFTVTRAVTTDIEDLLIWKQLVLSAAEGGPAGARGAAGVGNQECCCGYKYDIEVIATSRCHRPIKRWILVNAWPSEFSAADGFDNNTSEHLMESMTWEYDYFLRVHPTQGTYMTISIGGLAAFTTDGVGSQTVGNARLTKDLIG